MPAVQHGVMLPMIGLRDMHGSLDAKCCIHTTRGGALVAVGNPGFHVGFPHSLCGLLRDDVYVGLFISRRIPNTVFLAPEVGVRL
jgi:hypothetical protein